MADDFNGPTQAVVRVESGGESRYEVATLSRDNGFSSLRPIANTLVERWFGFARVMAPYMMLNDLLAGDSIVPRLGCVRAANIQLYAIPVVLSEVQSAFMQVPAQDASGIAERIGRL